MVEGNPARAALWLLTTLYTHLQAKGILAPEEIREIAARMGEDDAAMSPQQRADIDIARQLLESMVLEPHEITGPAPASND